LSVTGISIGMIVQVCVMVVGARLTNPTFDPKTAAALLRPPFPHVADPRETMGTPTLASACIPEASGVVTTAAGGGPLPQPAARRRTREPARALRMKSLLVFKDEKDEKEEAETEG
jgi:hypothetical protein